jgi:hypothetical protein
MEQTGIKFKDIKQKNLRKLTEAKLLMTAKYGIKKRQQRTEQCKGIECSTTLLFCRVILFNALLVSA